MCQTSWWLGQLTASVGLKMSPSIYFLSDYSPDAIGHCPTDTTYLHPRSDKNSSYSKGWYSFMECYKNKSNTKTCIIILIK